MFDRSLFICSLNTTVPSLILQLCMLPCDSFFFLIPRYHGFYLGQDVAVKILRSEDLNADLEDEFNQEVTILR